MIHHPNKILTPRITKHLDMRHGPNAFPKINLDIWKRAIIFIIVDKMDAFAVLSNFWAVPVLDAVAVALFVIVLTDVAGVETPGCAALGERGGGGVGGWEGESAGAQEGGEDESCELHLGYGLMEWWICMKVGCNAEIVGMRLKWSGRSRKALYGY